MGCCSKKKPEQMDKLIKDSFDEGNKDNSITDDNDQKIDNEDVEKGPERTSGKKLCYDDFIPLKLLGTGSFGRVLLVRKKSNKKLYAMKILLKSFIKQRHQEEHTKTERDLMVSINCPFVMNINYAFQDEIQLYLITDFMQGGDMFFHLHEKGSFQRETTKFYLIELVLALESLHKHNMIYRDLKPENILMDSEGHIKITDFGLSKILPDMNDKTFTLCGTPQYIAPELLYRQGYTKAIDWWSLGCVFYEMLTGCLPFSIPRGGKISHKIFEAPIRITKNINKIEEDLLKRLLCVDPKNRIGNGTRDAEEVKEHPYFQGVKWDEYVKKKIKVPFKPQLKNDLDLSYFDRAFTDEPVDTKQMVPRSRVQSDYYGFTYYGNSQQTDINKLAPRNENEVINDVNDEREEE